MKNLFKLPHQSFWLFQEAMLKVLIKCQFLSTRPYPWSCGAVPIKAEDQCPLTPTHVHLLPLMSDPGPRVCLMLLDAHSLLKRPCITLVTLPASESKNIFEMILLSTRFLSRCWCITLWESVACTMSLVQRHVREIWHLSQLSSIQFSTISSPQAVLPRSILDNTHPTLWQFYWQN